MVADVAHSCEIPHGVGLAIKTQDDHRPVLLKTCALLDQLQEEMPTKDDAPECSRRELLKPKFIEESLNDLANQWHFQQQLYFSRSWQRDPLSDNPKIEDACVLLD